MPSIGGVTLLLAEREGRKPHCFLFHKWIYWHGGIAIYRYCIKCKNWQYLARGCGSDDWVYCTPTEKELHCFDDAGWDLK